MLPSSFRTSDPWQRLERWCLIVVLCASWSTWLLTVLNPHRIGIFRTSLPLVFWLWFLVLYGGAVITLLAGLLLVRRYGFDLPGFGRGLRLGVLGLVILSGVLNTSVFERLTAGGGPGAFAVLAPVAGVLLLVGIFTLTGVAGVARRVLRTVALVGLLGFLAAVLPWSTLPIPGSWNPAGSPVAVPSRAEAAPLVLVGIDGADWDHLGPLMKQGALPHLHRLSEHGSRGSLETIKPTKSPAIWNTVATGFPPDKHGVQGFVARGIYGFPVGFPPLKPIRGVGFYSLAGWIQRPVAPVSSYLRMRPAYWNIATFHRSPTVVLNWWGTWPVEPIRGFMVSERIHHRKYGRVGQKNGRNGMVYPPGLSSYVMPRVMGPGDVSLGTARQYLPVSRRTFERMRGLEWEHHRLNREFPYIVAGLETNRRLARGLVDRGRRRFGRPPDALVLFRATDLAKHAGLKYSSLVEDHLDATPRERERYGDFVSRVYKQVDRAVGELLDEYDTANVLVVSDHGFTLEPTGESGQPRYHHKTAPDGIWIASGPAFKKGETRRLSIYDILPLAARVKGFSVADDWPGRVPEEIFREAFRARHARRVIPTYGRRAPHRPVEADPAVERSIEERLRGLGYLE